jgi:hypothetical protein
MRPNHEAGDEIGDQEGLANSLTEHAQNPGGNDANGDVYDQTVIHAGGE